MPGNSVSVRHVTNKPMRINRLRPPRYKTLARRGRVPADASDPSRPQAWPASSADPSLARTASQRPMTASAATYPGSASRSSRDTLWTDRE